MFAEPGSPQGIAVLARHACQFKCDSFARPSLSLARRDLFDNASQSFTDAGDIASRWGVAINSDGRIVIAQLTRHRI